MDCDQFWDVDRSCDLVLLPEVECAPRCSSLHPWVVLEPRDSLLPHPYVSARVVVRLPPRVAVNWDTTNLWCRPMSLAACSASAWLPSRMKAVAPPPRNPSASSRRCRNSTVSGTRLRSQAAASRSRCARVMSSGPARITAGVCAVLAVTWTVSHWMISAVSTSFLALTADGDTARHEYHAGGGTAAGPDPVHEARSDKNASSRTRLPATWVR